MAKTMKACVFRGVNDIGLEEIPIPTAGPGQVVVKVTLTTICGSDIHILNGGFPLETTGLAMGHEFVGIVHEIGPGVEGFEVGDRVISSCLNPCGVCHNCQRGLHCHCNGPLGSFYYGSKVDGAQAEYVLVPHAQMSLAKIPDGLKDEQVIFASDIMSTGFAAVERADISLGDSVAIFAQGPIGLCATAAAKLKGAGLIIAIDSIPERLEMAHSLGADVVLNYQEVDVLKEIRDLTEGNGANAAIEALGTQITFENALRSIEAGGTLSSVGVYGGKASISVPLDALLFGVGHHKIITTCCPGGSWRLNKLMTLVKNKKVDLTPLFTHTMPLTKIIEAYNQFMERRDGAIKIAIKP
jgi:alcohol dehydrogenase